MKKRNLKKPTISALEQRILFDGAAVATAMDVLDNSSFAPSNSNDSTINNDVINDNAENSVHEAQAVQSFEKDRREVAFVDIMVKDYQTLADGVGEGVKTYLVSSLDEIKSILENETNIDAIHILSHGTTGEITVGNDVLNQSTLSHFDTLLQSMKNALHQEGDILLYGCNVASDGNGQAFIDALATRTQADVAASDDATGASEKGGDWILEAHAGAIESQTLLANQFANLLATPEDQGFESAPFTGTDTHNGSATFGSWTIQAKTSGHVVDTGGGIYVNNDATHAVDSGQYLDLIGFFDTSVYYTFFATDGSEFKLDSFSIAAADTPAGTNMTIEGFRDGISQGTQTFVMPADKSSNPGANRQITLSAEGFDNIDEFRIYRTDNVVDVSFSFDSINVSNPLVGPTVTAATASYTDTAGNDTFSNTTGTISATPSSGSIIGYGIDGGTTGGSTSIGGVSYDVSKMGTYGTLHVNSTTGAYVYVPTSDSTINDITSITVTDMFTIEATDSAGTAGNTLTMTINGANDTPTLSTPTSASYTDTSANDTFTNTTGTLSASDRDSGATLSYGISSGATGGSTTIGAITYDISKVGTYGTLYVKSTTGAYVYVPNNGAINALSSSTTETFTVSTSDGSLSDTKTLTVNLTGVNDAPTLSATGSNPTYTEDGSAATLFSGASISTIESGQSISQLVFTVSNVADGSHEVVVIDGTNVRLTSGTAGTTVSNAFSYWVSVSGGTATITVDKTTTAATWQTLINSLTYFNDSQNPTTTSSRIVTLTRIKDSGGVANGGIDTTVLSIASTVSVVAANDAPTITAPASISVTEDVASIVTGISFADVDAGSASVTATLAVGSGTLNAISGGGVAVSGSGSGSLSLSGSLTNINAFISSSNVTFTTASNATSNVTLTIGIDDGGNTGGGGAQSASTTATLEVTAVNDAPTAQDKTLSINEDTPTLLGVSDFGFADVDGDTLASVKITSLASDGALEYYNGSAWVAVTLNQVITSADISANKLRFSPSSNANGTSYASFNFTVNDGALDSTAKSITYNVTPINDAPTVANALIDQSASVDSAFSFTMPSNTFNDVDSGDTLTYTAQLAGGGALPAWLSFNASTRTFSGTPASGDAGTVSIKVTATDNGTGALSVFDTFDITVNSGPTITAATASYTDTAVNDTFSNTTGTISASPSSGSISGYGISGGATGGSTLIGAITYDVSKAGTYGTLYVKSTTGAYVYVPNASAINATSTVTTETFTLQASDGAGTAGNTLTITINGANDTPTLANAIANQTATQDSAFSFQFPLNSFSDRDSTDTLSYTAQRVDGSGGNVLGGGTLPAWLSFDAGTRTFSGTPSNGDVGTIYLRVTATDGASASISDSFSITVANTNDAPTGSVSISGTPTQGQTLSASNTLADADGMGAVSYQWYANGVAITGATSASYTLTQHEVSKAITVRANYIDGFGTPESVTSSATANIANTNDTPTGSVSIAGTPTKGQTLTVNNALADADGMGAVSYQWYADGVAISGATSASYMLTQDEVSKAITVVASYNDGFGASESVTSNAVTATETTPDVPTPPLVVENIPPKTLEVQPTPPPATTLSGISINIFTDTFILGTINNSLGNTLADRVGEGYVAQSTPPVQRYEASNGNDRQADANVNVGVNGQLSFDTRTQEAFSLVGLTIESASIENNTLEIKVVDVSVAQRFVVTQSDGAPLPAGLFFDPRTGNITGTLPENLEQLDISIKAINSDGTTRVLNIKLDLKKFKESNQAEVEKFIGFKEQVAFENHKLDGYGSYVTKLFA